jgi:putative ABC transport system permease protein
MFSYYLNLALRSLKRNPVLTALMVLAIGLGIGASMTMITVLHVMSGDPIPGRSAQLFYPHLDPLPSNYGNNPHAPDASADFTWVDAMALLQAHRAEHQAAMSGGALLVRPSQMDLQPFYADGRYTTPDFFSMFGMPFMSGRAWSQQEEDAKARVVVLSNDLAQKLCGGKTCIGQEVRFGDNDFRVIGITDNWNPQPQFYSDDTGDLFSDPDQFFLPLSTAVDLKLGVSGNQSSWCKNSSTDDERTSGCMTWLQVWVQLKNQEQVSAYRQFLVNYSAQQKALGRFQRPATNAKLYSLMGWLAHQNLVPTDIKLQLWLAVGFLFVCMVNIVALLLAKFLRRSSEISVRRAMGAGQHDIFIQFSIESAIIGLAGGALGLGIAELGLWSVRQRPDDYARLAQMDVSMLLSTLVLALFASVLAGMLPAWRACRVPPASLLKTQ